MLSSDGSTLAVVSQFGRGGLNLVVRDTSQDLGRGNPLRQVPIPQYAQEAAISPNGSWLAYCYGRVVHLVSRDDPEGDRKVTLQTGTGENTGFQILEFGPDDSTLVVGTQWGSRRVYRFLNCLDGSVVAEGKGEPNFAGIDVQERCLVTRGKEQVVAIDMFRDGPLFSTWKWFQDRDLDSCAYLGNGKLVQVTNAEAATGPFIARGGGTVNNRGILIITRTATYFPADPAKPGLLAFGDVTSGLKKTVTIPSGIGPPVVSPDKDRIAFETGEGIQVWTTTPPALDLKIEDATLPYFKNNESLLYRSKNGRVVATIDLKRL